MSVGTVAVDVRRLARALYLECERETAGRYVVTGGAQAHVVEFGEEPSCDCTDFAVRGGPCKHLLCARLARLDAEIVEALRWLVPFPPPARG